MVIWFINCYHSKPNIWEDLITEMKRLFRSNQLINYIIERCKCLNV